MPDNNSMDFSSIYNKYNQINEVYDKYHKIEKIRKPIKFDINYLKLDTQRRLKYLKFKIQDKKSHPYYRTSKFKKLIYICDTLINSDSATDYSILLARRALYCNPKKPCNTTFCPRCTSKKQLEAQELALKNFYKRNGRRIFFATLYLKIVDNIDAIPAIIKAVKNGVKYGSRNKLLKTLKILGNFEIAVNTPDIFNKYNKKTLTGLGMGKSKIKPHYLVHLHALIDFGTDDIKLIKEKWEALKNLVLKSLNQDFFIPYQFKLQTLNPKKDFDDNIIDCITYMWKYSNFLYASDFIEGKVKTRIPVPSLHPRFIDSFPFREIVIFGLSIIQNKLRNFYGMRYVLNCYN